jgi:hypothetical protein
MTMKVRKKGTTVKIRTVDEFKEAGFEIVIVGWQAMYEYLMSKGYTGDECSLDVCVEANEMDFLIVDNGECLVFLKGATTNE